MMVVRLLVRFLALLLTAATVSGSQPPMVVHRDMSEYYIEKLGLTLLLPDDAYVTDRTVEREYPPLEHFGLSADQLEVQYKKGNIHCNAIWFPDDTDMTEIVVAMTEDNDSRAIFQLKDYDKLYQQALADSYAQFFQQGLNVTAQYNDASLMDTEQAVFVRAIGTKSAGDTVEGHLHYMTVANGQRIEITLIEHRSGSGSTVGVSVENEAMMDEIISSIRFDELKNEFVAKNTRFMTGTYIVLALSGLLIISYIISKIRVVTIQKKAAIPVSGSDDKQSEESGDGEEKPEKDT